MAGCLLKPPLYLWHCLYPGPYNIKLDSTQNVIDVYYKHHTIDILLTPENVELSIL